MPLPNALIKPTLKFTTLNIETLNINTTAQFLLRCMRKVKKIKMDILDTKPLLIS